MLISAAIAISAATCTVRTLRVMPTYTLMQETCIIHDQGKKNRRHVSTYKIQHPNRNSGSVPENFVIPAGDR